MMPAFGPAKVSISASSTHIRPDRAQVTAGQVVEPDECAVRAVGPTNGDVTVGVSALAPILWVHLAFIPKADSAPCRVWRCRETVGETTRTWFTLL